MISIIDIVPTYDTREAGIVLYCTYKVVGAGCVVLHREGGELNLHA